MSLMWTLILVAFFLFFFEIFLPGGVLAFVGLIALVVASMLAYEDFGFIGSSLILGVGVLAAVALFFIEINLLQRTPLGKQLSLQSSIAGEANAPVEKNLIGKEGVTLTRLAPSGKVGIDGRSYTASTHSSYLPCGATVRVVRADSFNIIVEKS